MFCCQKMPVNAIRKMCFQEKFVLMLMFLILSIPCKTLMVTKETKVKSWLHPITINQPLLTAQGASILSCMFFTVLWPAGVNQLIYFCELRPKQVKEAN